MRNYQNKTNFGGLPDSITTTKFGAGEFNSIAVELENAVTSSGQTLAPADGTGEETDQLAKTLSTYGSGGDFYADTGAANAYVLDRVAPLSEVDAYFDGMKVVFVVANSNTGASTVNVAGLGVKSITRIGGTALSSGDLSANEHAVLRFDFGNDRFEIEIYSGVKALEIGDGITVGGSASGDIPTLSSSGVFSGKNFSQDGTVNVTDTGNTTSERILSVLSPNILNTGNSYISIGKAVSQYNASQISHRHVSDDNDQNYLSVGLFSGDGFFQIYGDGHAELTAGYLNITDDRDLDALKPFNIYAPNLSTTRTMFIQLGTTLSGAYDGALFGYYFDSTTTQNSYSEMSLRGVAIGVRLNGYGNAGIGASPAGSGGARLTVNGDIVADNLESTTSVSLDNNFTTGTLYLTKTGRTVTLTWTAANHASASGASTTSGLIPAAYRPIGEARTVFRGSTTSVENATVSTAGTFSVFHTDWTGTGTARTSMSPGCLSYVSAS